MVIPRGHRAWQDDLELPDWGDEPIDEDAMAEDYNRAMDELQGFYPQPDDHDRRYDDFYSQQNGDDGREPF